jgi:hypothetical protein
MNKLLLAAIIVMGFGITATAQADKERSPAEQKIEDQVFSPEYLEQVNTNQQVIDSQSAADQRRHEKYLNQLHKQR